MIEEVDTIAAASSWAGLFATAWFNRATQEEHRRSPTRRLSSIEPAAPPSRVDEAEARAYSEALALIQSPTRSRLPRFDDTVAIPIDVPQRLDEIIRTARRALSRLPPTHQLSHRTVPALANLQRVVRDAVRARDRLAAGTYGTCTDCSRPISLSSLIEKPWTPRCIYCALSI